MRVRYMLLPMSYLLVALGSACGGAARYGIGQWLKTLMSADGFPWWTFAVNLIGSFCIVFIAGLSSDEKVKLLVLIGFMGGFTTFSSFSMETLKLMTNGQAPLAIAYALASLLCCLMAAWLAQICVNTMAAAPQI